MPEDDLPLRPEDDAWLGAVSGRLRLLSDPVRICILRQLRRSGPSTVTEIADVVGRATQNVSQHLTLLHTAGVVNRWREGKCIRYEIIDFSALWVIDKTRAAVRAQREERPPDD